MIHQYLSSSTSPTSLLKQSGTLAVIAFDSPCAPTPEPGLISVGLASLTEHRYEILHCGDGGVDRGIHGNCQWSRSNDVTCASVWISPEQCADMEGASYSAYNELLGFLADSDHSYPFRIWNFIPRINEGNGDLEEYKKFCVGRHQAFTELDVAGEQFPAASAVGNQLGGAVIFALASATPGRQHENPNQFRAYQYPRQYGPRSPSFSRATSIRLGGETLLFISGTSSILGHESQAPNNLPKQLEITLDNIGTLLELAGTTREKILSLRVYLRHAEHLNSAREYLMDKFSNTNIHFTLANICRRDLLVEIEAVVSCNP